ncbi:hypothetical protein ACHAQH_009598 [Verticillium albo-atrum]
MPSGIQTPVGPTEQFPFLHNWSRDMLRVLESDPPSYVEAWKLLPVAARSLQPLNDRNIVDVSKTIRNLERDAEDNGCLMLHLMLSMPRDTLIALILQTIDYDIVNIPVHPINAGGIYIASVGVGNRKKWLSRREICKVIVELETHEGYAQITNSVCASRFDPEKATLEYLDQYVDVQLLEDLRWPSGSSEPAGVSNVPTATSGDMTEVLRQNLVHGMQFVYKFENAFCAGNEFQNTYSSGASFISKASPDEGIRRIRRFVASLRCRLGGRTVDEILQDSEPLDDICQVQAPQYGGCSNNLRTRMNDYQPQNWKRVNGNIGLLMSALHMLRLNPYVRARCILCTWYPSQLPIAERLIITLGQCLVQQAGFNSIEGGGQMGHANASEKANSVNFVCRDNGFLASNLQILQAEIREMEAAAADWAKIENQVDSIHDTVGKLTANAQSLMAAIDRVGGDDILNEFENMLKENQQMLDDLDNVRKTTKAAIILKSLMYRPNMDDDAPSPASARSDANDRTISAASPVRHPPPSHIDIEAEKRELEQMIHDAGQASLEPVTDELVEFAMKLCGMDIPSELASELLESIESADGSSLPSTFVAIPDSAAESEEENYTTRRKKVSNDETYVPAPVSESDESMRAPRQRGRKPVRHVRANVHRVAKAP